MNDGGTRLVVLVLRDPHLLERGERREDRSSNPYRVLALGGSNNLDLHRRRGKGGHLLGKTLAEASEHGGTSREDNIGVKVLADINVALHDRLEHGVVNARSFLADERGLEEHLRAAEALVADGDDVAVGELVALLEGRRLRSGLHLLVKVEGDVGELLLDVADDLALGGRRERVATLRKDLHHVVREVASRKVDAENGVGKGVSFVDGDSVGDTIARVENGTSRATRRVQGKNSLDVDVHGGHVEGLEHNLGHALAVSLGVEGSLSEKDGVLLGGDAKLIVEGVVPDLLHIVPVGDDTVLDGVLERKNTTLGLGLVANVGVLLVHANHDTGVLGATHDRGKDSAGSVVTGKAGLAHAGAVVYNESLYVFVSHCVLCFGYVWLL